MNLPRAVLRAGPLSLHFCNGELRYLRLGEQEVLRRVYVAVRDEQWSTIPLCISNAELQMSDEAFQISFTATHQHDEIDFRWHGTITGDAVGTITFTMDGTAHSDFLRNRIGLCVLHSLACAGQLCRIERADGTIVNGVFPQSIAPHQPFKNIRAITHEILPGVTAEVRLTGDVFEMEDQRNWTDGSFKTYSTPLELPFPVAVKTGDRVRQSFTLSLQGQPAVVLAADETPTIEISFAKTAALPLPQLGLGIASHGQPLSTQEISRLRLLKLSHLRADIELQTSHWREMLAQAAHEARALDAKLELALFLSDNAAEELQAVRAKVETLAAPMGRWLIFHRAEKVTSEKWLALARAILGASAPIGAGTNQYFAELNRQPPADYRADVVCYSLNPQVHATDEDTLRESLAAQSATVVRARQFLGKLPLAITPVTLRPRFNPHALEQTTEAGALPAAVDVRQPSLFAAAWTLGSLKYLAESGVASATYYETTGWRGVMETEWGTAEPELFPATSGSVFPLWQVLADVGEFVGGEVLRTTSSAPLKVLSLALRRAEAMRLVLANLSGEVQSVCLMQMERAAHLRRLNADNVAAAMADPESFRRRPATVCTPLHGTLELTLQPNEIVTIDYL